MESFVGELPPFDHDHVAASPRPRKPYIAGFRLSAQEPSPCEFALIDCLVLIGRRAVEFSLT
jgi:hypothetical protein